ncbi:MAG: AbrB/MazE/SpoVT family DNA-binding domain-containing protein [Ignavibacteriaceae bacterium]|nr:AbrB/MazE/SpoVT family DNA-binding domain-containing protein [Ignavibacteriaceae bacterium]HMN24011.1 AbrB/MazE/SpoVT family DNA-binding domain-containing protein [Ignavibacteriaceae bacterium]HRN26797.1 AbrB/MazE/SpoVT family DNA-binding domain-containing protein [Ignavibacteriaceae bacterium]HRP94126.1 AbrB/MazE/SpoVT family DNA-binding domain-containing protein [Ignavibacteriaceae bacterium]HRQ54907.1 AbrB/MazE/SpoVT family DNA-binding domain-containing protein [Ignavibacteriaceae bacteri
MKIKIVKIGNSRGIRIPKSLIHESGLTEEVELELGDGQIIIKPVSVNRENWDSAFKRMAKNKDDILMEPQSSYEANRWDKEEWEW